MSGTEDLKNLLDRLKDEVGPLPPETAPLPRAARPAERPLPPQVSGYGRFQRPHRPESGASGGTNLIWSENKETMLFGVLASLILSMGGILAGLEYLVLVGAVFFMLFSLVMFLALFGYYLNFRRRGPGDSELAARVDALSRKVEMLSFRAAGGAQEHSASGSERERELEQKVEDLRGRMKNMSRSRDMEE